MKTKFKKQWTQAVAVAAAAVCAVTATCAGVTINHVDAADETYVAYLHVQDSYWAVNTYNESFDNSVELTGDGSYSLSVTNGATYAAGDWEKFNIVLFEPQNEDLYTADNITIDSVVVGDTIYDTVEYTVTGGQYSQNANGDWPYSAVVSITATDFATLGMGESVTVNFTIGEAGEETTTTTTTTTTASSEEDVTTTTTTDTTESSEDTTTTTTVTESSDSSEGTTTTTTTTESTTKATTTTTTTTPKATTTTTTTAPNYDKVITAFTKQSEKGEDGKIYPFIEVEHNNAKSITLVYKVLTDDTNTSGAIGTGGANWSQESWNELAVPTDKLVVINYVVPSTATETLKISVYWPGVSGVEFKSVTLHYDSDPDVTTTEYDSGLTFETVTVGADNKIDMKDKCCLVATIKGPSNYNISGGVYYSDVEDEFKEEHTDSATNLLTKVFEVRGESICNFQIHWYSNTDTTEKTAPVHFASYYVGDASLNGTVNGSDVRAIVNYAIGSADDEVKNIVCDYDDSGEVKLADAIALTKALLAAK